MRHRPTSSLFPYTTLFRSNVRSRARFAQKMRPRAGILRHPTVDDLEGNSRVQNCIASAISYGHSSRTELDRKTIRTYLHFEVGVSQWSGLALAFWRRAKRRKDQRRGVG